jgi:uncharacterized iron-regulated membrane protein
MQIKKSLLVGVIGLAALGASLAFAGMSKSHEGPENDAALLPQAKISLTQAIAAAEGQVPGKAVRAELENENGTAVYGVEVSSGAQATDVKVDANSGKILSAQADRPDHDAKGEKDEKGGEREDD